MIFHQFPNHGDEFTVDGIRIRYEGKVPYETKDGRHIELGEWRGPCAQCGCDFPFQATLSLERRRKRCRSCVKAQPFWNSRTADVSKRSRNAKISASLKAHHDKRLGRNELP
jgi:hypothetical protein